MIGQWPHSQRGLSCTIITPSACAQLSNANTLSSYLLGSGSDTRKLPVARAFQSEVVGDSADAIRRLADGHGSWLQGNCERQVAAYRSAASSAGLKPKVALCWRAHPAAAGNCA